VEPEEARADPLATVRDHREEARELLSKKQSRYLEGEDVALQEVTAVQAEPTEHLFYPYLVKSHEDTR